MAKQVDLRSINAGKVRHPVYGNRRKWVLQSVPAGFWDDAMTGKRDDIADALRDAMVQAARDIAASVK